MIQRYYRPEIDGLRALAVALVVLYHAKIFGIPAGFLGVDVFFVLSGYLITQIILRDLELGQFTMANFLERRARRILPALFLVVLICIPAFFALMVPYQLVDFGKSLIATVVFVSNILFWRESSYFAQAAELKPLLHTWSLSIEEQFYLIYPWVLILFAKSRRARIIGFFVCAGVSVFLAQWLSSHSIVVANFFLLPSRLFELLIGALAAHFQSNFDRLKNQTALIGSAMALLGIIAPAFIFSASTPHPSVWTLIPVLSTAFLLLLSRPDNFIHNCLSCRFMVGLGTISYSLYLWHHPVFAWAKLKGLDTQTWFLAVLLIGIATVGATLSWKWIENPIRHRLLLKSKKQFAWTLVGTSAFILVLGTSAILTRGFIHRFDKGDWPLLDINPTVLGRYTEKAFRDRVNHPFDNTSMKKKWLVIGDSYAQDFVNLIAENNLLELIQLKTFPLAVRCPKYFGSQNIAEFFRKDNKHYDKTYCENFSNLAHAKEFIKGADVIVLANHWRTWEAGLILETIENLRAQPRSRILILGSKDFGDIRPLDYLGHPLAWKLDYRNKISPAAIESNNILRRLLPPHSLIDILSPLCSDNLSCPIFTSTGELISFDGHHFTPAGARHVGSILFELTPLKEVKPGTFH